MGMVLIGFCEGVFINIAGGLTLVHIYLGHAHLTQSYLMNHDTLFYSHSHCLYTIKSLHCLATLPHFPSFLFLLTAMASTAHTYAATH